MRVTVSHNKGVEGAKKIVNDSAEQLLSSTATSPVTITDVQRRWEGSTMYFSFTGRMGILSAPIKGLVECRDAEVMVDVELPGVLKHFIPEEKVKQQVEGRVRGLLT